MGIPTSDQLFTANHAGVDNPDDPSLFTAAELVAGSFGSAAVSASTSAAVSTVNAAAPDSTSISQARSQAVSAASVGSVADSKAVSGSFVTSTADSKALSVSGSTSIADSKAVSVATATPVVTAIVYSANISIADSKAVSVAAVTQKYPLLAGEAGVTDTTYPYGDARRYGGDATGVADSTSAFLAALTAYRKVKLPSGTFLVTDNIAETLAAVEIEGETEDSTFIDFLPTVTGKTVLKFNKGLGVAPDNNDILYDCKLKNLTIRARSTPTLQKFGIQGIDTSELCCENVTITGFTGNDGTTDANGMFANPSTGFKGSGREFTRCRNLTISAERPVWFATNPNYTTLNADHGRMDNIYLLCQETNGANIFIDPTVILTTTTFGGSVSGVGGKYGIFRKDADGTAARSYQVSVENFRHEQATAGGYLCYWVGNVSVLSFKNCQPASASNGWYVRYAQILKIDSAITTNASGVNIDIDSTVLYACGSGNDWIDGSTFNLGTNTVAMQSPRSALKNLGADFIITQLNPFNALALLGPALTSPSFAGTATGNLTTTGNLAGAKVIGGSDPGGSFDVRAGTNGMFTSGGVTANGTASTFGANTAAGQSVIANGAAGNSRGFFLRTAGSNRAFLGISATAEGGSNAGSDVNLTLFDDAGSSLGIAMLVKRATQFITFLKGFAGGVITVTYSTSMTIDASQGNLATITATDGVAFTINTPTNPTTGQRLRVRIRNTSGGALGAATWTAFKMGAAWTQPANGFSRSIDFDYNGTNWVEANRSAADIAN